MGKMMLNLTTKTPPDRVASTLRARILSGELAPGARLETVRELAETMKHGQAAIVRGIERLVDEGLLVTYDRKGTYVSERTEWKPVPRNIAILTGVPTSFSASVLAQATHLSGLNELQRLLIGAGEQLSLHGCVFYPNGPVERRYTPPRKLALESMDAIVAAGIYELAYLGQLLELELPVIAYDVDASAVRMDSVFVDETEAAFQLTQALLKRGHRRIALLAGARNAPRRERIWNYDPAQGLREDGYRLALRAAGLEPEILHQDWAGDEVTKGLDALPAGAGVVTAGDLADPRLSARGFTVAGWSAAPLSELPAQVAAVSGSDHAQMGTVAGELVRWRLEHLDAPIQRRALRPKILQRG
jgi:DNA-binding transcriptional regulator YhcF (GntR family)